MGAGAIIFDDAGRVLFVRQSYGDRRWSLPGGEVDEGESPYEAVVREVLEETGLMVTVSYLVSIRWLMRPDLNCPYALFGFRCEIVGDALAAPPDPDEIEEVGWFPPEPFPQPSVAGAPLLLADAVAGLRGGFLTASITGP
jgi:8-oxo-dGTP diphosphatase